MANETDRGGFQKATIAEKQRTDLTMNNINRRTTNGTHHEQQLPENRELTEETKRLSLLANNGLEREPRTEKQNLEKLKRKISRKLERKALSKQGDGGRETRRRKVKESPDERLPSRFPEGSHLQRNPFESASNEKTLEKKSPLSWDLSPAFRYLFPP
uniref:Uncharacterized protein n=1 Tax=Nelumbo nucifera TaxID=4432 RepID=A0A822ZD70_NELNU|nr:TPA_asm: hypothetical protein HUJ06_015752 [Nelumbo nucifera]